MGATLYGIPSSHPTLAAELMLRHKGIGYRRVDFVPTAHKPIVRLLGFPRATVPALRLGRRRVQGTARIAAALDELAPEPPLHPADPRERAAVERAERWADGDLQSVVRTLAWWVLRRHRDALERLSADARLGVPAGVALRAGAPFVAVAGWQHGGSELRVRAALAALPALLDRADALIATGTIGGERPNVADFQVATSVRALLAFDDLRAALAPRPAAGLATRLVPRFPGSYPRALPPDAVAALAAPAP